MGQMGMRRAAGGGLWGRRERSIGGSLHTSLSDVPSGAPSRNVERPEFPKAVEGSP